MPFASPAESGGSALPGLLCKIAVLIQGSHALEDVLELPRDIRTPCRASARGAEDGARRGLFPRAPLLHVEPVLCWITLTSSQEGAASVLGINLYEGPRDAWEELLQQGHRGRSADPALCALLEASPTHWTLLLHLYNGHNHTLYWKLLWISDRSRCTKLSAKCLRVFSRLVLLRAQYSHLPFLQIRKPKIKVTE